MKNVITDQDILNNVDKMERESFYTIDPTMDRRRNFDPTNGMNKLARRNFQGAANINQNAASQTVSMNAADPVVQFTVTITNTMLADLNIELFQFDASQTEMLSPAVNNYVPASATQFGVTFATGTANQYIYGSITGDILKYSNNAGSTPTASSDNIVGFNASGDLVYQPGYSGGALPAGNVTIKCAEVPYKLLFKYAGKYPFAINRMRMQFASQNQITQTILEKERSFLGSTTTDQVNPNTYFTPNQFQSLIIDVPTPFQITSERGLNYNILGTTNSAVATNYVTINMFLQLYIKPNA